jgi:uncharacterized membrane protein
VTGERPESRATLDGLDRLEARLGHLLRTGVMSAAACLGIGLIAWMVAEGPLSRAILTIGLVILMVTPLLRVIVSLVAYARMRDWFFVTTTVLVFVMLLLAWLLRP